jgi:RHS repeat-associated protein
MGCKKLALYPEKKGVTWDIYKSGEHLKNHVNCLDYGARFYDPEIARWHSIDPLAEFYRHLTPYRYGLNNPLRYSDMGGLTEIERTKAVKHAQALVAKGAPYVRVESDCATLVAKSIEAAGFKDFRYVGSGRDGFKNGVAKIVGNSRLVDKESMRKGDIATFKSTRSDTVGPDGIYDHIGMIEEVKYDDDGKIIGFFVLHASFNDGYKRQYYDMTKDEGMPSYWLKSVWAWDTEDLDDKLYHVGVLDEVVISANAPRKGKMEKIKTLAPEIKHTGSQQGRKSPGDPGYTGSYWDTYDRTKKN